MSRRRPSSDPCFASAPFSHKWEKGALAFDWVIKQKNLKLNLATRILLPLVGEGGPAKRGRMRGLATESAAENGHPA